jgi:hypothetical protein
MTTLVPFTPSLQAPFQFQATLDGAIYTAIIKWNVFGQRWYFNLYTSGNVRVVTRALIGSPTNYRIDLVAPYFTASSIVFRQQTQTFEIRP